MKTVLLLYLLIFASVVIYAAESGQPQDDSGKVVIKSDDSKFGKYLGAGLAIGAATLGSGIAVGRIGASAMGAISEKQETTGTALIFVALAEGICLWGVAGAFIILFN